VSADRVKIFSLELYRIAGLLSARFRQAQNSAFAEIHITKYLGRYCPLPDGNRRYKRRNLPGEYSQEAEKKQEKNEGSTQILFPRDQGVWVINQHGAAGDACGEFA
jgi:hypothetical protein